MKTYKHDLKLKLAWQTAFELRTCPVDSVLFGVADENLERHLRICHRCREKLDMPAQEREAWGLLQRRFAESARKPAAPSVKTPGQVWSTAKGLGRWHKDGYFRNVPMVLLLAPIPDSRGFKAVQLYHERALAGDGDVWLGDEFGFAEAWNCYTVHEDALEGCWGAISEALLKEVRETAAMEPSPVPENSIQYYFRKMEVSVGAGVSLSSVASLTREYEAERAEETLLDRVRRLVSIDALKDALRGWGIPAGADDVLRLAALAVPPPDKTPLTASGPHLCRTINHMILHGSSVVMEPALTELTFSEWQGDGYLVSGRLSTPVSLPAHVFAVLGDTGIEADLFRIAEGERDFDLLFSGASKEESRPENLEIVMVTYA